MSLIMHNNSGRDMSTVEPYVHNFYSFAKKKLGFDPDASVHFVSDSENAKNPLGKTASYSPSTYKITIYIDGRHLKDILRSISHELVHHAQNCRGDFDVEFDAGEGYAQKDPHLRKMEKEAYLLGSGIYFRDWEDHYKQGVQLMQEWRKAKYFEVNSKLLKEEKGHSIEECETIHRGKTHAQWEKAKEEQKSLEEEITEDKKADEDYDDDGTIETSEEEWKGSRDKTIKKGKDKEEQNESLRKKEAGDELKESYNIRHNRLNESLMKKWFKK